MKEINYDYVSDEEDGAEGKWIVRKPCWRSQQADSLMNRLQQRIEQSRKEDIRPCVPRMEGPRSVRSMPRLQVAWALKEEETPDRRDERNESESESVEQRVQGGETPREKRRKTTHRRVRQLSSDKDSDDN